MFSLQANSRADAPTVRNRRSDPNRSNGPTYHYRVSGRILESLKERRPWPITKPDTWNDWHASDEVGCKTMLKNSKFAVKIAMLPAMAALSFVIILVISWTTGRQGIALLEDVETGYYSSLELNRQLYDELEAIQLAFQDAAAMADAEFIRDIDGMRDRFIALMEAGEENTVVDTTPLVQLQSEFASYYDLARVSTQRVIDGSAGMSTYADLQAISDMHLDLLAAIESLAARDVEDVSTAISEARSNQRSSTFLVVLVVAISLFLLIAISILIIRVASQSIQTTVDGINALASGDLSTELGSVSSDEMGKMVRRVNHVTGTINALTSEVHGLIESVRAGELRVRGEPDKFQGAYAQLIENINELIDAFVAPIDVTANYVERISRGDIPPAIDSEYRGEFNLIKENLNRLASMMNGLIHQVAAMTSAAQSGNLEERGNPKEFAGAWRELVVGINETLDAVTRPLGEFSGVIGAMAHGDLNTTSTSQYEGDFAALQSDINSTVSQLTDVISAIKNSGDSVAAVATDIASGNQSLRHRTEDQATNLRTTSENMESMTAMVRQNASDAQRAKIQVEEASDTARRGGAVVGQAVRAMDEINAASGQIADISNVINEIAFQTNLLALNAAVEAARAGEEGRGFAVVASEVRNLAGRSAQAAKEINDLIQDSVRKVEEGSRLVHDSGQTLEEIVTAVIEVADIVTDISASSQEQTVKIDDVNQSIASMDKLTAKNAELADVAVRASELMGEEAARLNEMTAFFAVATNPAPKNANGGAAEYTEARYGANDNGTVAEAGTEPKVAEQ